MFRKLKNWIIGKTIYHAESRYSIFVWMRQVNERLLRLEEKEAEAAIKERAELEMQIDAKLQKVQAQVEEIKAMIENMENMLIEGDKDAEL